MSTASVPLSCDLIVRGGSALTMDDADRVLFDVALAIADGRILAVGAATDVMQRFAAPRTVGSAHHILMPGLVNTHNHTPLMIVRGVVEDIGFAPAYTPGVPQGDMLSAEETYLLARLGAYEMLRFGSTTVVDFYRHPKFLARALMETGLRGFVGGRIMDANTHELAAGNWVADRRMGERTLAEAVDFLESDVVKSGGVTPILGPHAPDTCSRDLLRKVAAIAKAKNCVVHTHLHQSSGEVSVVETREKCRPVELLEDVGLLDERLVAGHCIHMNAADIERFGRSGAYVAHIPIGNAAHGSIAPIVALERAGARITLATDTKSGDMFESLRMALAATRIRGAGFAIKSERVLGWATRNGAAALGLAGEVGVLRPGARADIVMLDGRAPNLCPLIDGPGLIVHSANGGSVDTVLIDGRIVLESGRPTLFDGDEVVAAAQSVARRLWERAGRRPRVEAARA